MTKNAILYLFLMVVPSNSFAQQDVFTSFLNALEKYNEQPYEEIEESIAWEEVSLQFEKIVLLNPDNISELSKKLENSFDATYSISESKTANKNLEIVTLSNQKHFYHINYVVDNSNKHRKILLKESKFHQHYLEIYTITNDLFLLMEQMDELAFSCNYASVYQKRKNEVKKINAFNSKTQLTICNFTNIETGTNAESLAVKKISFNEKTKIISYSSCTNFETGETTQPKAVFKNNNFDIEDCDERKGF